MDFATYRPQIAETFQNVRNLSFEEKRQSVFDEEKINLFLDTILDFKKKFIEKTFKIEDIVERVEKISWFNNLDNEDLMLINDLISSIRDLHSSLIRQYNSLIFFHSQGIANEEIENFKIAVDDLKEVAIDLESRFFYLPKISGFIETTNELSLV